MDAILLWFHLPIPELILELEPTTCLHWRADAKDEAPAPKVTTEGAKETCCPKMSRKGLQYGPIYLLLQGDLNYRPVCRFFVDSVMMGYLCKRLAWKL